MDTTWYPGISRAGIAADLNLEGAFDSSIGGADHAPFFGQSSQSELRLEIKKIYGRDYPELSAGRPLLRGLQAGDVCL